MMCLCGLFHTRNGFLRPRALMKKKRTLDQLSPALQRALTSGTWCENCFAADLGIRQPELFEQGGKTFVEGRCNICGTACVMEFPLGEAPGTGALS